MEKDKGKRAMYEAEDVDLLKLLMDHGNQPDVSSPFQPLSPLWARNPTQNSLLTNYAGEAILLQGSSSSSSSKEDTVLEEQEKLEDADADDFFFKLLTMSTDDSVLHLAAAGSSNPPVTKNVSDDGILLINQPDVSSPFQPLSPLWATQNGLLTNNSGETILLQGSSSSSSGSPSSKQDSALGEQEKLEGADDDDFFFKLLTMSTEDSVLADESFKPPATENVADDDMDLRIVAPPEVAVHPPAIAAPAATNRSALRRAKGKVMSTQEIEELAMQDPKKAKRIIANRTSAVKAKEKKKLYICMLEDKIQSLNSERAALKAHLTLLQTESKGLNAENVKLKEQTDLVLHQLHFQESLNEEVRNEIMQLRTLTQMIPRNEMMLNNNGDSTNNNNSTDLAMDQASLPLGREEFLHLQNQVPYPYQMDQLQNGVEQMNLGQQYYPWQVQPDHPQTQQATPYQDLMQQQPQSQEQNHHLQYQLEELLPYDYLQQHQEVSPFSDQEPVIAQDPNNIANPPPYSSDDKESNDNYCSLGGVS
ncbi:bZIP transcription factor 29-like [Ricinus communis]|uniref:bZIP transcription factor 29-like n=1 Tax=Ricinus communis TaxID=3988 RepID=UPI00201AF92A|nr:bZIP transcription factor 29-like [Ricinus communis]